ncbi:MAG: fructose-bisphosphate aldolase class I [Candidatus Saccharibacteria bacterium]|nr:fructose-bisphosphate aldolase class I [Candidatus Saccharibacteria bacterium]
MNILIVGNILKDVYLGLDTRTESFEKDSNHTDWLNLSFDASEHHFFNRTSSFAGAIISLEVLEKMGLSAKISGSNFHFSEHGPTPDKLADDYRYILTSEEGVSYFVQSNPVKTKFTAPETPIDYLYIDRSAILDRTEIEKISNFLTENPGIKLVLYLKNDKKVDFNPLLSRANLIFLEEKSPAIKDALPSTEKIVKISENSISYLNITEQISAPRIDRLTHLSAFSIIAATILGGFLAGKSVEESLKMAKLNVENSTLNSSLSLSELETKIKDSDKNLELIAANLVLPGKGILAADESGGSIKKKFAQLEIEDTFENRHDYRNLFFTTENIEKYLNGVILFDETARDKMSDGQPIPDYLISKRIIPGIKVDQGLENFENSTETYTKGLDGLESRLAEYYKMGLRFAKWRAAFNLTLDENSEILTPTNLAISKNCEILAAYAKKCQTAGIVPIVEPELVYDGYYDVEKSEKITEKILDKLFEELEKENVNLRGCILKVNMVMHGKQWGAQSTPEEVGKRTAETLKNHVPKDLAGVVFLSGGQTPEQATENLAEIAKNGSLAFPVTFSYARALQDPALYAWAGKNENTEKARQAFADRLLENIKALR